MSAEFKANPKTMAELWPMQISTKKGGYYVKLRDTTVGPFKDKKEAGWHLGMLQDVIMGWVDSKFFVGLVRRFGDAYYVDRWDKADGPFMSLEDADAHRDKLFWLYPTY